MGIMMGNYSARKLTRHHECFTYDGEEYKWYVRVVSQKEIKPSFGLKWCLFEDYTLKFHFNPGLSLICVWETTP